MVESETELRQLNSERVVVFQKVSGPSNFFPTPCHLNPIVLRSKTRSKSVTGNSSRGKELVTHSVGFSPDTGNPLSAIATLGRMASKRLGDIDMSKFYLSSILAGA